MNMKAQPAVVVLAAGEGSRFGGLGHKLAQPFYGSTVLGATLKSALATQLRVVVVVRESLADLAQGHLAAKDVVVLANGVAAGPAGLAVRRAGDRQPGMGSSIAAGVEAASDASAWLIWPADMPMIRSETATAVARAVGNQPVAYAQHRGRRGHPVAFSAELYSELVSLSGDEGARRLIARYPAQAVELPDPGILFDIDTESDLSVATSG
jgi:molybdenum cofactor cytidylyltransferase